MYFSAPEAFTVEPRSSKGCEVVFKPLVMTIRDKPHEVIRIIKIENKFERPFQATIFFYLPQGKILPYNLKGIASEPLPIKTISREIPWKRYHTEILSVRNWLNVPQQFSVISQSTKPDASRYRSLYKLTCNDVIDLPPQGERDYAWTIYALKEGSLRFNVSKQNRKEVNLGPE